MQEIETERQKVLNELDPQVMEMIRAKVKETELEVNKMLENRSHELDEKLETLIKQKKK
jgi:hypothetical protein